MINNTDDAYLNSCRDALQAEQTKSLSQTNNWEHVDREKVHNEWDLLYKDIAQLIDTNKPEDEEVQKLMGKHYAIACKFYRPSKKAYIGMGLFYNDNEDMKNYHNAYHPKMVEFLIDAIHYYSETYL
ncbi:TipAS antibiotic-recognition domain-containing protein [Sulfurimonas sp.]|uniref:TipAS antibiotic-recognition domain-containing protein n=1 Tax=Sulfurimonas sp. TaxID=2022749 RepID=UPI003D0B2AD2